MPKTTQNVPKLLIIISDNWFWVLDTNYVHFRPRKSLGGIVIDIWEKSNFSRAFGSQKGAKNAIFVQGGLMVGLKSRRFRWISVTEWSSEIRQKMWT